MELKQKRYIRWIRLNSSKYNPLLNPDEEFMQNLQKDGEEMLARKDAWD